MEEERKWKKRTILVEFLALESADLEVIRRSVELGAKFGDTRAVTAGYVELASQEELAADEAKSAFRLGLLLGHLTSTLDCMRQARMVLRRADVRGAARAIATLTHQINAVEEAIAREKLER